MKAFGLAKNKKEIPVIQRWLTDDKIVVSDYVMDEVNSRKLINLMESMKPKPKEKKQFLSEVVRQVQIAESFKKETATEKLCKRLYEKNQDERQEILEMLKKCS